MWEGIDGNASLLVDPQKLEMFEEEENKEYVKSYIIILYSSHSPHDSYSM